MSLQDGRPAKRTCGLWVAVMATTLLPTVGPRAQRDAPAVARIVAFNYSFELPARVRAGRLTLRLVNAGGEPHYALLYRLADGKSASDFVAWRRDRGPLPAWLATRTGPAPVVRGDSTDLTLTLEAGRYLVICGYPSANQRQHVDMGMLKELEVVGNGERGAAPAPTHRLTLTDSTFRLDPPVRAGRATIAIGNTGSAVKQALIVRLPDGVSLADERRWFDEQFRAARPGVPSGGALRLAPGEQLEVTRDFVPGRYAILSHATGPWQTLEFTVTAR